MNPQVVELIRALAWPITVIWLGSVFKRELQSLISRVAQLKHGDTELIFARELATAAAEVDKALPATTNISVTSPSTDLSTSLHRIAEISPRAAILEAWNFIEDSIYAAKMSKDLIRNVGPKAAPMLVTEATRQLPANLASLVQNLRSLRNRAAHENAFSPSFGEATIYVNTTLKVINAINALASIA